MALTESSHRRPSSAVALLLVSLLATLSLLLNHVWPDGGYLLNEENLVGEGYEDLWKSPADIPGSLAVFENALRRDPASPFRWQDLGGAFLAAGRVDQASHCFQRALLLGPYVPAIQMRFANFAMQTGKYQEALTSMRGILEETAAYDDNIFGYYSRLGVEEIPTILRNGVPETPRAAGAFLLNSLSQHDTVKTRCIWDWAASRGLVRDNVADAYVSELIRETLLEAAGNLWASYVGVRRNGYRQTTFLYNGGFEYPLSGSILDWKIGEDHPSQAIRDRAITHSGSWSIRMQLGDGAHFSVSQYAILQSGIYSFEAWVRSTGASPNALVSLQALDDATGLDLGTATTLMTNSQTWTHVKIRFPIWSKIKLLKILASASDSGHGNSGTVWIDDMTLQRQKRF